ncbi:hypothetical protein ACFQL1_23080 [Halomicroarcula sp. GCM10025709]|uniref:hypothetical protein n=1 Tax=Haloarcula TaxID=2237 RepID=UPI0024C34068|nr:hypothetical protein [Halomicroarcula sp. YJ-61-S]
MTTVLHALRAVGLAAVDLAVGALLFGVTTSPIGLLVIAVGLLVLLHVTYTGAVHARTALTERRRPEGV